MEGWISMAYTIKGEKVVLYETIQTGVNALNAPIYTETPVTVENVLICPVSTEAIVSGLQLYGKHAVYELCIPKGDAHNWEDKRVEFFGQSWHTFGFPQRWTEANLPLGWNLKVKVERYG